MKITRSISVRGVLRRQGRVQAQGHELLALRFIVVQHMKLLKFLVRGVLPERSTAEGDKKSHFEFRSAD